MKEKKDSMKTFEVWSEGYAATCEHGKAIFEGKVEAKTFREACIKVCGHWSDFDKKNLTVWACQLFDNEEDARKSFG